MLSHKIVIYKIFSYLGFSNYLLENSVGDRLYVFSLSL